MPIEIGPESIGDVYIDSMGFEVQIVHFDKAFEYPVTGRYLTGDLENRAVESIGLFDIHGDACGYDGLDLIKLKPVTLVAPKKWWNIYRDEHGEIWAFEHKTYEAAAKASYGENALIGRIYDTHWHGHEVGRFDQPE